MQFLPPAPGWDGLHPLIVHFPIALLTAAPLLVLVGLLVRKDARPWTLAGLLLAALGTLATWVATGSGHAAAQLIQASRGLGSVVERHEDLGLLTRNIFTGLTLLLAVLYWGPGWFKKTLPQAVAVTLGVVYLVLYAGGLAVMANAAHQGGRLVHEFGVHAVVAGTPGQAVTPAPETGGDAGDRN